MTAETPPAPPAMNDLMDSLVDEDPLAPAGLLSTKVGSSLYIHRTETISGPCSYIKQSADEAAHHRGGRSTGIGRWRLEGNVFSNKGHVILQTGSGRIAGHARCFSIKEAPIEAVPTGSQSVTMAVREGTTRTTHECLWTYMGAVGAPASAVSSHGQCWAIFSKTGKISKSWEPGRTAAPPTSSPPAADVGY